ncbi:alpha/beta hydrolase [Neokomagataea anthophila]|uniref:Alpha/beta fold hydrolase n=1 Tax=Neokomagataea anthophila TaxID=2826925 RepID=A0ABS5E4J8_9PROT|nr:alpha/beta fold hydrolase [Neokomagataea anthophila]MBR0558830.1 alpha/beta fold hydrolase [Neokomagataea anthophila]
MGVCRAVTRWGSYVVSGVVVLSVGLTSCAPKPVLPVLDDVPGVAAGQVVRVDRLGNGAVRRGWRLTYRSLDGQNAHQLVRVSAQVFLPSGKAPQGGWPVLAWAHGARGLSLTCAPSIMGEGTSEQAFFEAWLRRGYAIIATDYQGLGEPGQVLFMNARSEGMNVLDAVRAARVQFSQLSSTVIVYGHSQGAQAALAAAGMAASYAPGLAIRGVIAAAPPFLDQLGLQQRLHSDGTGNGTSSLPVMMSLVQSAADAGEDMQGVYTAKAKRFSVQARSLCIEDFAPKVHKQGLKPETVFAAGAAKKLAFLAQTWTAYPSFSLPVPVLIGTGLDDHHNTALEQDRLVRALCHAGSIVQQEHFPGANHFSTLRDVQHDAMHFADSVRLGRVPQNTCPAL